MKWFKTFRTKLQALSTQYSVSHCSAYGYSAVGKKFVRILELQGLLFINLICRSGQNDFGSNSLKMMINCPTSTPKFLYQSYLCK